MSLTTVESTALPLRVTAEGRLQQQDVLDALLTLIGAMAATTASTWPNAPWFGLLEQFTEASRRGRQDHEGLRDSLDAALKGLGIEEYRVQSVTSAGSTPDGRVAFDITLADRSGHLRFGRVAGQ